MKKFLPIALLAGLFAAGVSRGATVNWAAFNNTGIITAGTPSSAAALQTGNWVQIGYFDSSLGATQAAIDAAVSANAGTVSGTATLAAAFHTFGSLQINTGLQAGNNDGGFTASSSLSITSNPGFASQQIYVWALKATNNTSLTTAEATVTQQAIAYVPASISTPNGATDAWRFPSSDISPNPSIELTSLTTSGTQILAGSFFPNANNTSLAAAGFPSSNAALQLSNVVAPVPEPTTFAVGILLTAAAIGIRRRSRG